MSRVSDARASTRLGSTASRCASQVRQSDAPKRGTGVWAPRARAKSAITHSRPPGKARPPRPAPPRSDGRCARPAPWVAADAGRRGPDAAGTPGAAGIEVKPDGQHGPAEGADVEAGVAGEPEDQRVGARRAGRGVQEAPVHGRRSASALRARPSGRRPRCPRTPRPRGRERPPRPGAGSPARRARPPARAPARRGIQRARMPVAVDDGVEHPSLPHRERRADHPAHRFSRPARPCRRGAAGRRSGSARTWRTASVRCRARPGRRRHSPAPPARGSRAPARTRRTRARCRRRRTQRAPPRRSPFPPPAPAR